MKKLLLALVLALGLSTPALAQCNGTFPTNTVCGNITGATNLPRQVPITSLPVISALTQNHIFVGSASNLATDVAMTGDCSIVASGAITCTKLNGVSPGTLYPLNVGPGLLSAAGALRLDTVAVSPNQWFSAVTNGLLVKSQPAFSDLSGSITAAQSLALTSGNVYVGNGSNQPANVAMSGDCTMATGGAITCNGFGAWTNYTPTLSCATGTITTATPTGRYRQFGKSYMVQIQVVMTTIGSCATSISATLPATSATAGIAPMMAGRNTTSSNVIGCTGAVNTNTISCQNTGGGLPVTSAQTFLVSGVFESN